jgi:ATP-dependent helicase/nuclease subunit B
MGVRGPVRPAPPLVVAVFGQAATRALAEQVAAAKAGDPMAPVTVVVPSAVAGVTLRRRLAADGGLVNVRFTSLPDLAAGIARATMAHQRQVPLTPVRAEAVAAAVLADRPGVLAGATGEPSTARALVATFADLDEADEACRATVARSSRRGADVVRLHRAFTERVAGQVSPHDQIGVAATAVEAGAPLDEVGGVIVHVPRRLRPSEVGLVGALSRHGRLSAVVGVADSAVTDEPTADLLARLEPLLGPSHIVETPSRAVELEVVRAIDPAEEARIAVRRVVAAIEAGVPLDRIAVVSRLRDPYRNLLHEELAAAAIPHRVAGVATLAQRIAGRTLLGLLALADGGLRRLEVTAWLRSAPIVDPATRCPIPAPWWDRLAREAGVVGGLDQWRARLARAIERRAERHVDARIDVDLDQPGEPDPSQQGEPTEPVEVDRKAASLADLARFIDDLAARLVPPSNAGARSWRQLTAWARRLLDAYLDRGAVAASQSEQASLEAVGAILDELGDLDGAGLPADRARLARVVAEHLDRPVSAAGILGHGVTVGSVADLVGADFDLTIVVGATEGELPPARTDDPLLPNRERRSAGLARRGLSPAEERRDLAAALASAGRVLVTTPRADPRGQREAHPARWLLDLIATRLGRAVIGADLDRLATDPAAAGWFTDVVSFEWWAASGRAPATPHEHDIAAILAATRAGLDPRLSSPAHADPVLARGLAAVAARRYEGFGPWTGQAGPHAEFLSDLSHPQSSTALEHWVVCPFRYFLGHVLRVDEHDDPAEPDWATAMVRGSVFHEVLERFVGEAIDRPPDRGWTPADRARLHALADEVAGAFESEGRTGRPLLWELARHDIHRQLDRILDDDDRHRSGRRLIPVAVEHAFGFDDTHPPVRIDAGDGREVVFRGFIDRIDRTVDGDRLVVLDYKTGSPKGYPEPGSGDLTANGRFLQLLVYAAAARAAHGDLPVESYYWFVGERGDLTMRGGEVDTAAEQRLGEVLAVLVDGIGQGTFPARPGEENYFRGFENCRWCPYDRVCSTDRAEQWERVKGHRDLRPYCALVEPEPPAPTQAPSPSNGRRPEAKT